MTARDHVWLFWEWDEDCYLADDLLSRAAARHIRAKTFPIEAIRSLSRDALVANPPIILWDRAGDAYDEARHLADWAEALGSRVINPVRGMLLAKNKGILHRLLLQRDLPVPHTQFLNDASALEEFHASNGKYLVLKPVRSGGGEGVRMQQWCEGCLREAMQSRPGETWLLQEYIEAATMAGRRAWFRVFYLFGDVRICWWDNRTHIYDFMPCAEVNRLGFHDLCMLGIRIGATLPMQFFSTEIAYREDGKPVIVDYINDPCDLRCKTRIPNGVPPELLDWIFGRLFDLALALTPQSGSFPAPATNV